MRWRRLRCFSGPVRRVLVECNLIGADGAATFGAYFSTRVAMCRACWCLQNARAVSDTVLRNYNGINWIDGSGWLLSHRLSAMLFGQIAPAYLCERRTTSRLAAARRPHCAGFCKLFAAVLLRGKLRRAGA